MGKDWAIKKVLHVSRHTGPNLNTNLQNYIIPFYIYDISHLYSEGDIPVCFRKNRPNEA